MNISKFHRNEHVLQTYGLVGKMAGSHPARSRSIPGKENTSINRLLRTKGRNLKWISIWWARSAMNLEDLASEARIIPLDQRTVV